MQTLIKEKRVRFSDPQKQESNKTTERSPPFQQIESFMGALVSDKVQNWFQTQFPRQMSEDYDSQKSELAVAVAAAAYSIYSLEEAEARYRRMMRTELEMSRTKSKSIKEDTITRLPSSGRVTKEPSNKELKIGGETSARNLAEVDRMAQEPISRPCHPSTVRNMNHVEGNQKHQVVLPRHRSLATKADAWERDHMEKINKRYEKMTYSILAWENEKKMQARLKMEKKKGELEQRRALNIQHYENKIARIERIAGGARAQVEEERRNKEHEIKQKAKMIRSRGKVPVKCFCC